VTEPRESDRRGGPWPSVEIAVYCRPSHPIVLPFYLREFDGEIYMSAVGFQSAGSPADASDVLAWLSSKHWDAFEVPVGEVPDSVPWPGSRERRSIPATGGGNVHSVDTGSERQEADR